MGNGARLEQSLQLDPLPLAVAEQRHHVRHGMDAADQKLACDVDVGAMTQRPRDDRLDDRKDVLYAVIEFVDDGRQPPLETDPHLDFPAHPQVIVGDVAEQAADPAGQREPKGAHDRRRLLGAPRGIASGVIDERPVAMPKVTVRVAEATSVGSWRSVTTPWSSATNS